MTDDDVAIAIIAACRETGEDPLTIADRNPGMKARHYAFRALSSAFPAASPTSIARCLGSEFPFRKRSGPRNEPAAWYKVATENAVMRAYKTMGGTVAGLQLVNGRG